MIHIKQPFINQLYLVGVARQEKTPAVFEVAMRQAATHSDSNGTAFLNQWQTLF